MPRGMSINRDDLIYAIDAGRVEWTKHVLQMIRERRIRQEAVLNILRTGERIEDYPDDYPCPSALFLGWADDQPIHAVVAFNDEKSQAIIVTVYEPDMEHFEPDYRTRRTR